MSGEKLLGISVVEGLADKGLRRRPVAGSRDAQKYSSDVAKDGGQAQSQEKELSVLHTPHGGRERLPARVLQVAWSKPKFVSGEMLEVLRELAVLQDSVHSQYYWVLYSGYCMSSFFRDPILPVLEYFGVLYCGLAAVFINSTTHPASTSITSTSITIILLICFRRNTTQMLPGVGFPEKKAPQSRDRNTHRNSHIFASCE